MESKSLIESYPMVGGDGPYSYAQNSSYQKRVVDKAKLIIRESIAEKLDFENLNFGASNSFHIADLGCSVGPNTFTAVQNIIEAIEHHNPNPNPNKTLEFQVFFNDHTENDFNTLFKSLPSSRKYYAAGVPGSFHGRLFPNSSIHFAHCSCALHWLSRVPKEVVDPNSAAWNKGSIYCSGLSKDVSEAYGNQFKNDMNSFLCARAEEIVNGGLMALILCFLPNGVSFSSTLAGITNDMLGSCLFDLAKLGLISKETVESFNIPVYLATIIELEEAIKENGYFSIEKMSTLANPPHSSPSSSPNIQRATLQARAAMGGLVTQHFGNEILDMVFECFANKLQNSFHNIFKKKNDNIDLFILLKRKFD